jgi:hypothetical protein
MMGSGRGVAARAAGIPAMAGRAYRRAMAEIVNLRQRRKALERQQKDLQAAANRVKFGRGRAEKTRDAQEEARRRALLDGAALDGDKPDGDKLDGDKPG